MTETTRIAREATIEARTGGNGGRFAFTARRMGPAIGLERLACCEYVVPPGKRAFPYHAHSLIEEMFVILEGSGTLRHEDEERAIEAGDVIAAPLGEAHQIINDSDRDLRYLAISTNEAADVVMYPDSDKIQAYSLAFGEGLFHVTRRSDATGYYDGEE